MTSQSSHDSEYYSVNSQFTREILNLEWSYLLVHHTVVTIDQNEPVIAGVVAVGVEGIFGWRFDRIAGILWLGGNDVGLVERVEIRFESTF